MLFLLSVVYSLWNAIISQVPEGVYACIDYWLVLRKHTSSLSHIDSYEENSFNW